jgi:hypothetical protein
MLSTVRDALQDCLRHADTLRHNAAVVLPLPGASLRDQDECAELKPLRASLELAVLLSWKLEKDVRWILGRLPPEALNSSPFPAEAARAGDAEMIQDEAAVPIPSRDILSVEEHLRWLVSSVAMVRAIVVLSGTPVDALQRFDDEAQRRDLIDRVLDVVLAHAKALQKALPADAMMRNAPWR